MRRDILLFIAAAVGLSCGGQAQAPGEPASPGPATAAPAAPEKPAVPPARDRAAVYASVRLTADLGGLSDKERRMLPVLIRASEIMDELFWLNAYGDKAELMAKVTDPAVRRAVEINYGPWDRLDGDVPFVPGIGPKPPGASFYPHDMTKQEFEAAQLPDKKSLYTILRRGPDKKLTVVPFREAFAPQLEKAAGLLREAAGLAEDKGLRRYLELRAKALVSDDYRPSDMAWLDMKSNRIDFVVGPIETYEDALFGYKAAYEASVLVKDVAWSKKLARYARVLPALQRGLPVPAQYKRERPGADSDLNAYDVLYYAGHVNAGSKTIAINLPNDEKVQLAKGTRRLQLKNAMRAKFDKILTPIAREIVVPDQMANITFEAFFANVMFHEVAHGLGIKNTINKRGTVREALKEHAGALEEAKADIVGLYMITRLFDQGEMREGDVLDHYVTFLAGLLRSVRFGASSAHGKANMVELNFLEQQGAFVRDQATGLYKVDLARMRAAVEALAGKIIQLQGDGDYDGVASLYQQMGVIGPALKSDLDRLGTKSIPVDVVFEQGTAVLGLSD